MQDQTFGCSLLEYSTLLQAQDQGYQSTLFVSAIQQSFPINHQKIPRTMSNVTYNHNQPVPLLILHQGYLQLQSFYGQQSGKNEIAFELR